MMAENKNIPEIRFAGFTDPWEQRKLSDLAEIVGGGTPDTNNSAYWDGDIDWYAPAEMEGQRYAKGSVRKITELGLQKSSAKILPAHRTVLFTSRAGIGKMAILQRSAATNQGFQSLVLKDGTDPYFIYSMGEKIKDMAEGVASGSTFLEISGKMLGNLEVMVPNLKEQESIATFFRSIDDLITLHQRKYDRLKNVKKSMLEKMFPRDGANVPEIRFAGFTDAWEQRKLSDLAEIVGGGTPDTNNSAYWDGDIDWYAPAEMEGQRYAKGSVRKITELGLQKSSAKILPAHRTVLFTSRAGIGKMAILQRSAATNQGFQSLVLKDGTDPYFIYSMGEKIKDMAEGVASGSTFLEISGKMLGNLEVMVPNLKEQESIATFFRSIDDLITLHQRKYEKLKQIKKSMLEKMFV